MAGVVLIYGKNGNIEGFEVPEDVLFYIVLLENAVRGDATAIESLKKAYPERFERKSPEKKA